MSPFALLALLAAVAAPGQPLTVAYFNALQEQGPLLPEELAARQRDGNAGSEAIAADLALNEWKACVLESIVRWAPLKEGVGTIVDGAFGRCGDIERDYRGHLMRITQDGRVVVDLQLARTMIRGLEEAWRPRLIAAALDQALAAQQGAVKPR
ncbi:hypothetical protein [Sphingomonas bacterium]|uniref:hypothetical protein n=1 Tax=Sphingomonas bacterium TaxID=1895847 RepID=UPI001575F9CA|nr:hypothetical protein [Sphingomonas bacterium]